jgi:hydroxymethylpyrimidine/phosphomethylpyrimidine kinase
MSDRRSIAALTIAGSDSGGGAGIQADLKTFAAHGIHGLSAITALTAQNTRGITAVHVPPASFLRAQIDACFEDYRIGAVKIGMLANADVVHAVADALHNQGSIAVVLDPVMVATSGAVLLDDAARDAMVERLFPLASLLTPNRPEAEALLGSTIRSSAQADEAIERLRLLGVQAVLLKGGHLDEGSDVVDRFSDGQTQLTFRHPRLAVSAHGTGCTLSSAIAANLCLGKTLIEACRLAGDWVHDALRGGYRPGTGDALILDTGGQPRRPTA